MKKNIIITALTLAFFAAPAFAQVQLPDRTQQVAGKVSNPEAMVAIERANQALAQTHSSLRAALESMDETAESER